MSKDRGAKPPVRLCARLEPNQTANVRVISGRHLVLTLAFEARRRVMRRER